MNLATNSASTSSLMAAGPPLSSLLRRESVLFRILIS